MGIRYINKTKRPITSSYWRDYDHFKNDVNGEGFFGKLSNLLLFDKSEKIRFKEFHEKVGKLHLGLEDMIKNKEINPILYLSGADAIIYRFLQSGRKDLPYDYLIGIDFGITNDDFEWKILEKIKKEKGLRIELWRLNHASYVKKYEDIKNEKDLQEILESVLEFSELHKEISSVISLLYHLE